MPLLSVMRNSMNARERVLFIAACALLILAIVGRAFILVRENSVYIPVAGGSWSEGIVGQPVIINPAISDNAPDIDLSALVYSSISDLILTTEAKSDQKTYSIKLKENLLWEDGERLTSDDIIFTIQTIQHPESRSPQARHWQGVSLERVSELHVVFTLPEPYSLFPEILKQTRVIPQHIFGNIPVENFRLSAYGLEPVGSGPYRVKNFKKQKDGFITEYRLVPNELYAGEKPFISDIYLKFYKTDEELEQAFRERKIQAFGSLAPVGAVAEEVGGTKVDTAPMPRYYAIFMNQANNPALKSASLRRALDLAIDKNELAKELGGASVLPVANPLVLSSKENAEGRYDPDAARAAIEKAGGSDLALNLVVPHAPLFENAANIIQRAWVSAGVGEVNIYPLGEDALDTAVKARDYEMILFGNILEHPYDLYPFWHSSQAAAPHLNLASYQNARADRAIENAREAANPEDRLAFAEEAAEIIESETPAVFLFTVPYSYIHAEHLAGFDGMQFIALPSSRFDSVERWSVVQARILR